VKDSRPTRLRRTPIEPGAVHDAERVDAVAEGVVESMKRKSGGASGSRGFARRYVAPGSVYVRHELDETEPPVRIRSVCFTENGAASAGGSAADALEKGGAERGGEAGAAQLGKSNEKLSRRALS